MEELIQFELYSNDALVAHVSALSNRGYEYYDFTYSISWLNSCYPIDPSLEISPKAQRIKGIPPYLRDLIPDR